MVYQFEEFELDEAGFRLSRAGEPVSLEPKAVHLLLYLLENRNRMVRKQELLDCVWQEANVTENALTRSIGLIRRALNDDSRVPRFIQTTHSLGYRFIAPVMTSGDTTNSTGETTTVVSPELIPAANSSLPTDDPPVAATESPSTPSASSPSAISRRAFLWTATGSAAAAGFGIWFAQSRRRNANRPAMHLIIQLASGDSAAGGDISQRAGTPFIAPDGSAVVISLPTPQGRFLFSRRLDSEAMTRMDETLGADNAFWSADSQHIGFFVDGKLKKMPAAGGSAIVVCDATESRGATWNHRGVILFARNLHGLYKVSEDGGAPEPVTQLHPEDGENSHRFPAFLPDGNRFLYFARTDDLDKRGIYIESLDGKLARRRVLVADGQFALGTSPEDGQQYIFTQQAGKIVAQTFDADSGTASGTPHVMLGKEGTFSVSDTGIFVACTQPLARTTLTWRDRAGRQLGVIGEPDDYYQLALSPAGRFVAVVRHDSLNGLFKLWVASLPEGVLEPASDLQHISTINWLQEGELYYQDNRQEKIFRRELVPLGPEEFVQVGPFGDSITDLSPDGKDMLIQRTKDNVHIAHGWSPLDSPQWHPIDTTGSMGWNPRLSPDGKWLAFPSNKSGRFEIYLMDFPQGSNVHRISTDGGTQPHWRHDGKELFYIAPDESLMAIELGAGGKPDSPPKPLFRTALRPGTAHPIYGVSSDGQRFLLIERDQSPGQSNLEMILDWPSLLPRT